jgi:hypothetical protein
LAKPIPRGKSAFFRKNRLILPINKPQIEAIETLTFKIRPFNRRLKTLNNCLIINYLKNDFLPCAIAISLLAKSLPKMPKILFAGLLLAFGLGE